VADWGGGMSVSCGLWIQLQLFTNADGGWLHSAMWYHYSSMQSAAIY